MAAICEVKIEATTISNEGGQAITYPLTTFRFSPGTGNGDRRTYSIAATTFQALVVPTSSKACLILPGTATSLVLKGLTADNGVNLTPSSSVIGLPVFVPLGSSPSIGIYNGASSATTVEVIFF